MTRRLMGILSTTVILAGVLALLAFAVTHRQPGVPLWHKHSGNTLTEVHLLPSRFWSVGTTPMTMTTATGAPVNGGSTTRYWFIAINRYDLRVWHYDPKTGIVFYSTDGSSEARR